MNIRDFKTYIRAVAVSIACIAPVCVPVASWAANTFYGITEHVSSNNIKVRNPRTGQTLSFEILPKFDQVFSGDGKTTYQMRDIRPGRYIAVVYDQKFLGMRHADRIFLLTGANKRVGSQ